MPTYRKAFLTALVVNVALAAGLGLLWWRTRMAGRPSPPETPASQSSQAAPAIAEPGRTEGAATLPEAVETPLSPVQLSPERLQSIGVKTGVVEVKDVHQEIRTTGDVEIDEGRLAYVQVRFPGWIQKVYADAAYRYVHRGQPLFTIYSPDLVATEREYLLARQTRSELAGSSVPGVAAGASSLVTAAVERLKQWDIPPREIDQLKSTGQVQHEIEMDSPFSGFVTERNALPNLYVQPETRLYTLADLSTVWVYAQVLETDLGKVRAGEPATVTVDAYPGRNFTGRVQQVLPQVDMNTRTARVRVVLPNSSLKLMPGMFVNVALEVPLGRQLVVPASAVLQPGSREIVFVDHSGGHLEPRDIASGSRAGDDYIVLKGLKAQEKIVTSANFLIDSESQLQAAIGSFAPPPPGAGEAAAVNASSNAADIELITVPSPPHKGVNSLRVKLTQKGAPVTGAAITATFYMSAMPAMGMSAQRTAATLNDRGNGTYEGQVTLESAGTWQVTILAQKSGQTFATRQASLNAEGGR